MALIGIECHCFAVESTGYDELELPNLRAEEPADQTDDRVLSIVITRMSCASAAYFWHGDEQVRSAVTMPTNHTTPKPMITMFRA